MARADAPDWDAIRRDYRTGQFSNRELGRMHRVAESTIRKRAENRSWERDLAVAVQAETLNQLTRDAVAVGAQCAHESAHARTDPSRAHARANPALIPDSPQIHPNSGEPVVNEAAIVAAAAQRGADVVRGHRAAAARLKAQFDRLAGMVDRKLGYLEQDLELGYAIDEANMIALDGQPQGGALKRETRSFGLLEGAELLDTMARALARMTAVERLAFNLDGKPGATPVGLEEGRGVLTPEQRQTALANIRARTVPSPKPDARAVH